LRSLEFDSSAFEDLAWWIGQDRTQALRIVRLVREVQREPFVGLGKPEPLKHELSGCWSRRIDQGAQVRLSGVAGQDSYSFLPVPLLNRAST